MMLCKKVTAGPLRLCKQPHPENVVFVVEKTSFWIYFDSEIPFIITGQIINLEEDMIEIRIYPSNKVIYIDFKYQGIPHDFPIKSISIREKPKETTLDTASKAELKIPPQEGINLDEEEEKAKEGTEQEDKTDELEEAINMDNQAHIKEELGDLFFSLISLSRHLNIDIDDLNQSANDKFRDRLEKIKDEMKKRNIKYADPLEMIDIWKTIKNK